MNTPQSTVYQGRRFLGRVSTECIDIEQEIGHATILFAGLYREYPTEHSVSGQEIPGQGEYRMHRY